MSNLTRFEMIRESGDIILGKYTFPKILAFVRKVEDVPVKQF
jgi:hypothetical protein